MKLSKAEIFRPNFAGDRLENTIPLMPWFSLDVTKPGLYRVQVDSQVAQSMLELNTDNRRLRKSAVDYLKKQIAGDEWRPDHPQPVIFSDTGRLIDGQHRIRAIMESALDANNAVTVRVETGANDSVREYLDTGVPRTLDDRVQLVDDQQSNKVISQLCAFGFYRSAHKANRRPTPEDAKEFFSQHVNSCLFVADNHKRAKGVGRVQVGYAAMEYYEMNPGKAMEFYPSLMMFDGPVQQARMLRDWLLRTAGGSHGTSKINREEYYFRSIGCMKAHQEGRTVKIVRAAAW